MKILSGFLAYLFANSILVAIVTIIPFRIFIGIIGLEIAVSLSFFIYKKRLQAYVFCVLTSSYIKDSIDLH